MPLKKIDSTANTAEAQRDGTTCGNYAGSDFSPRQMLFRESAVFMAKLFAIVAAIFGLLWFLDLLVTR
jgi:hypothetical protein